MKKSTVQLLRFHFSFFLMPVYWFAVSQLVYLSWPRAILIFFILHFLVYPSSNGYNSYMDRDQTSIGGLKNPLPPTRQLYRVTVLMDLLAVLLGIIISWYFAAGIFAYILASRAYSYRGIRIKKYAIPGFLLVVIFQGAVTFLLVYHGAHEPVTLHIPFDIMVAMLASSLLVAAFYPLTQIYQHEEDRRDGIRTISSLLGYRGTFLFVMFIYFLAFITLAYYFYMSLEIKEFRALATCLLPVLVYFFWWAALVWRDYKQANFKNTMRMNVLASCCTNLGFILVLLMNNSR